jgi:hypothetical protein
LEPSLDALQLLSDGIRAIRILSPSAGVVQGKELVAPEPESIEAERESLIHHSESLRHHSKSLIHHSELHQEELMI